MKTFGLFTKDNELIVKTDTYTEDLSIAYFSELKKISEWDIVNIFNVKEIVKK